MPTSPWAPVRGGTACGTAGSAWICIRTTFRRPLADPLRPSQRDPGTAPTGNRVRAGAARAPPSLSPPAVRAGTNYRQRIRPEVVALLAATANARYRFVVTAMWRMGLRRGELLGLRRSDVLPGRCLHLRPGRSGKSGVGGVPLGPAVGVAERVLTRPVASATGESYWSALGLMAIAGKGSAGIVGRGGAGLLLDVPRG